MAMLTAWSKSPKLSLGQTRLRSSSLVTTSPGRSSKDLQQFQRLLLDPDSHPRFAHFARLERNLIGSESHDGGMPQWFHIWASHGSLALCPGKSLVNMG